MCLVGTRPSRSPHSPRCLWTRLSRRTASSGRASRRSPREIAAARRSGRRWKLVCQAERAGPGVRARVAPEMLPPEDPLYTVMGTSSSITFESDALGRLTITEEDPGPATTAFGLLADFINAMRTPAD